MKYCITLLLACFMPFAFAQTADTSIRDGINNVITKTRQINLNNTHYAIVVQSVADGHILYTRNGDRLYTPASVQKLFTAAAGLAYLKPHYQFSTRIYSTGNVHDGTLSGNLYIKFCGDPFLKVKQLNKMFEQLHEKGIHAIKGHVYIDTSDYNNIPYPPGWIWDDLSYGFAAPLNTIILNQNKFVLRLMPADKTNGPPKVISPLPKGIADFENNIRTTNHKVPHCPLTIYSDDQNHYRLSGCINQKWGRQRRTLAIRNVMKFTKYHVSQALKENYIRYDGTIGQQNAPQHKHLVLEHKSKPLSKIVHQMLKESDNLTTDAVFKKLGQRYYKTQGNWQNSVSAVENILQLPAGINFNKNRLDDGAGLSRYDLITPNQLIKLLYYVNHNPTIKKAFFKALPIAGKDGTLIDRMLDQAKTRKIHAKTGGMTGVTSLAGYIETRHHGELAFVIMINNFVGHKKPYLQFEDKICEYLTSS